VRIANSSATDVYTAKMTEPIEKPFGGIEVILRGPEEPNVRWGEYGCHLADTIE